jgi:cytochrome c553
MSVRTSIAKITTISILLSLFSGVALAAGDPAAGQAQAITCAACHGQDGATAIAPSYPNLAGQNEVYLTRQLQMFQSGQRDVALMSAQLIGKSEQDLADLGAYYSSLPGKHSQAQGSDEDIVAAERLYKGGDMSKGWRHARRVMDQTAQVTLKQGFLLSVASLWDTLLPS